MKVFHAVTALALAAPGLAFADSDPRHTGAPVVIAQFHGTGLNPGGSLISVPPPQFHGTGLNPGGGIVPGAGGQFVGTGINPGGSLGDSGRVSGDWDDEY